MRNNRNFNEGKNPAHVNLHPEGKSAKKRNYRKIILFLMLMILAVNAGLIIWSHIQSRSADNATSTNELFKEVNSDKIKTYYFLQNGTYYKVLSNDTWNEKIEISRREYERATS